MKTISPLDLVLIFMMFINYIILQRQEHAVSSAPFNTSLLALNRCAVTVCYISFTLRLSYIQLIVMLYFLKSIAVSDNKYFIKYEKMYWVSKKTLLSKKILVCRIISSKVRYWIFYWKIFLKKSLSYCRYVLILELKHADWRFSY